MLIVFRTNAGFEGEIAFIDRQSPAPAMDTWLTQNQDANLDYIEVSETDMAPDTFAALIASVEGYGEPGRFYVADVDGVLSLMDGGM